ncbi:oligosaccharide flippase family protein [Candidatus Woesearchaeota archaeon]|nr:oligosaccharide flippase family protein [Nanoarchaeota archaeon]MCB9371101.1 oligosaccharide flippase family protein [Candidatus Woesearchaeota archaeon]USN44182.1 MAG: oligosaccharide flippase family protein [Candidatus Woesearchaeota archaeon]
MKRIVLGLWSSRAALLFFSLKLFGEGLYYVLPLFIAYVLSPELFTSFTLAQMLVVLWATLTFGIFQTPLIVKGVKESSLQDHIRASFTTVLVLFFVSLFLGFFVLFFCRGLILDFTLLPLSDLLSLLAFLFGLLLKRFVDGVFLALSLKLRNAWYDVLTGFFSFVFLGICFLFFGSLTLSQVFFSYFFSSFFALLFFLPFLPYKKLFPLSFDREIFSSLFCWGLWQVSGLVAVYFINWGDTFVLRFFSSVQEIATYALAYSFFKAFIGSSLLINTYYLPSLTKAFEHKQTKFFSKYLGQTRRFVFFVSLVGILLLGLFVFFFADLFYKNYEGVGLIFVVLLAAMPFRMWTIFYLPLFNASESYAYLNLANVVHVFCNIILDILFVFSFGVLGVALATTLSYILRSVADEVYYRRKLSGIIFSDK